MAPGKMVKKVPKKVWDSMGMVDTFGWKPWLFFFIITTIIIIIISLFAFQPAEMKGPTAVRLGADNVHKPCFFFQNSLSLIHYG